MRMTHEKEQEIHGYIEGLSMHIAAGGYASVRFYAQHDPVVYAGGTLHEVPETVGIQLTRHVDA